MSRNGTGKDALANLPGCARNEDDEDVIRVVIETPKGSRNKYAFDAEGKVFELKKVCPQAWVFRTISVLFHPQKRMTVIRSMYWCLWTSPHSQDVY